MIRSSLLLIAAAAGFNFATAADLAGRDASPAVTVQQKAIEPTCITAKIAVSSSCNIGVHTKRAEATGPAGGITLQQKAIPATCHTYYTTTTECHIGVHPQPTDLVVTVTETSKAADGKTVATTVTTAAQASISAPASAETGTMGFVLTPKLRTSIVKVINAACPRKLKAREDIELVDLACTLPDSSYNSVYSDIQRLIGDSVAFDEKAAAALFGGAVSAAQVRTTLTGILITAVLGQAAGNGKLSLSSEMSSGIYKPLIQNPPAGGDKPKPSTISTSSDKPAPTGIENAPYHGTIPVDSAYTAMLTKYLEGSPAASKFTCTHGAQPGLLKGETDYCYCAGKYYPTSKSTYITTISGTKTTLNDLCPYTAPPKSTFTNAGNTILPTGPAKTTAAATAVTTARTIPSEQCLPGAPAYSKLDPVKKKISAFCSTASKQAWSANAAPTLLGAASINALNAGQSQEGYTDVKSDQAGQYLYLQVRFDKTDCAAGQAQSVDFKKNGVAWCVKNFEKVLDNCPNDNNGLNHGGYYYDDCVEWFVGSRS